ncbi:MAG: glutathione S-transferase family protein [Rhizobiaceae bacterium]|nr:MAG: glutathione S-transferase family protein [Rhizobiaceae bacterium]
MITVHGRATSSNVQLVMWTVGELGLEHRRLDVGGSFGGTDTPEYRAMNPNGLVPVLQDGDVTLFESVAIMRYLAARYGEEGFWPKDPAKRASLDQWAEWGKVTFSPAVLNIFIQLVRMREADRKPAAIAGAAREVGRLARILDDRLGEGPYLDGAAFTFADIAVGALLYRYMTLPFEKAETPRLDAYYKRLTQRPAFARHVMVSYESLRAK